MPKQTRGWDDTADVTRLQRHKEESTDYRYFPEPDLVPVVGADAQAESIRESLGELPADLRDRLESSYGITPYDGDVLVNQGPSWSSISSSWPAWSAMARRPATGYSKMCSARSTNSTRRSTSFPFRRRPGRPDRPREGRRSRHRPRPRSVRRDARQRPNCRPSDRRPRHQARRRERANCNLPGSGCRQSQDRGRRKGGKLQAAGAIVGQVKKRNANVNPGRVREICLELIAKM